MEKIMSKTTMQSKTNDTSKLDHAALEDHGILANNELDAVTVGAFTSFASFGDIKGESTDKDHRDWVMNLVDRI
jgi:hypothetical protein